MNNTLSDISQYNDRMTISQVIRFLGGNGVCVTKSMVQNYVRDGLLPPPVNGRYYTYRHLVVLVLANYLKTAFDMKTIKSELTALADMAGMPLDVYQSLVEATSALMDRWRGQITSLLETRQDTSMHKLMMMIHCADTKASIVSMAGGNRL